MVGFLGLGMGGDGVPLMPGNDYVPLISNLRFTNITGGCSFSGCKAANRSKCFDLKVTNAAGAKCPSQHMDTQLPPQNFGCKKGANTLFGHVDFPWGVCIPLDAPVNLRPDYPNWGPAEGTYATLEACQAACHV